MTVSSQTSSVSYLGDGVTTILAVPFYFLEQEHLLVTQINLDSSTQALTLGSDYSVSGAGNQSGGSIFMFVPAATGIKIQIDRSVPATQETDYVANDPFPAESHERALDKLTMLAQQIAAGLGRALLKPIGKDYYDAQGKQIKNLGDPTDDQDATTKAWASVFIADLISQIQGPINNAANIFYVKPNGGVGVVQDMSSTSSGNGAAYIGNAKKCINASQWGCVAGADISTPLQAAANTADLLGWELVMDIPNAIVTGDLVLPQFFNGAGCVFTGSHTFIHRARKHARAHSFTCNAMLSSGVWHSQFDNINVIGRWTIDGYEANWGTFWNTFKNIRCGQIRLNVQYQAVNQNNFLMCLGNEVGGYGVLVTDEGSVSIGSYSDAVPLTITSYSQYFIKDAVAYSLKKQYALPFTTTTWAADSGKFIQLGIQEAHNNVFQGCDVSHSGGFYNEVAVRRQFNHIIGGYAEHGAQIIGPWNTFGVNIDGSSPPIVTSRNHVIGQTDQSLATMGDSFSASPNNIAIGGDWHALDSTGKPPCFSASFAATVQGTLTPTNWGYTGRYGGTVTGVFQNLNIKFTSSTGKFSAVIFMEFPTGQLPVGIVIDDGTTQSFRTPTECINEDNGRYLYRISGGCVPNVECTIQFLLTGGTSSTATAFIGAAFVSANKAALMPMFQVPRLAETSFSGGVETKRGQKSQSYVSGGPSFDISVTYGSQFLASNIGAPSISLLPVAAYRGNATKHEILTATISGFTARVYYTTEWAGDIFWRA